MAIAHAVAIAHPVPVTHAAAAHLHHAILHPVLRRGDLVLADRAVAVRVETVEEARRQRRGQQFLGAELAVAIQILRLDAGLGAIVDPGGHLRLHVRGQFLGRDHAVAIGIDARGHLLAIGRKLVPGDLAVAVRVGTVKVEIRPHAAHAVHVHAHAAHVTHAHALAHALARARHHALALALLHHLAAASAAARRVLRENRHGSRTRAKDQRQRGQTGFLHHRSFLSVQCPGGDPCRPIPMKRQACGIPSQAAIRDFPRPCEVLKLSGTGDLR